MNRRARLERDIDLGRARQPAGPLRRCRQQGAGIDARERERVGSSEGEKIVEQRGGAADLLHRAPHRDGDALVPRARQAPHAPLGQRQLQRCTVQGIANLVRQPGAQMAQGLGGLGQTGEVARAPLGGDIDTDRADARAPRTAAGPLGESPHQPSAISTQ